MSSSGQAHDVATRSWDQLFDDMARRAETISDDEICELRYPLPWEYKSLSAKEREQAVRDYERAVVMNFHVQDNLQEQLDAGKHNVLPELFHCSKNITAAIVERVLHPNHGELWFGATAQFQYGHYEVGLNSTRVHLKGRRSDSRRGDADWFYTDSDIPLDFTTDIIVALRVADTIELQQQLALKGKVYNILTVELLGTFNFNNYCLNNSNKIVVQGNITITL